MTTLKVLKRSHLKNFHVTKLKVVSLYIQHEYNKHDCNKLSVLNLLYVVLNYYISFYYRLLFFGIFPACHWTSHCVKGGWEASLGGKTPSEVKFLANCKRNDLTRIPTYLPVKITTL